MPIQLIPAAGADGVQLEDDCAVGRALGNPPNLPPIPGNPTSDKTADARAAEAMVGAAARPHPPITTITATIKTTAITAEASCGGGGC